MPILVVKLAKENLYRGFLPNLKDDLKFFDANFYAFKNYIDARPHLKKFVRSDVNQNQPVTIIPDLSCHGI